MEKKKFLELIALKNDISTSSFFHSIPLIGWGQKLDPPCERGVLWEIGYLLHYSRENPTPDT
jgi:hypothetical protein